MFTQFRDRKTGRFIKCKVLNHKKIKSENANNLNIKRKSIKSDRNLPEKNYTVNGCRIIDISLLADELWCRSCNEILSLSFILSEARSGYASFLSIRCKYCNTINKVKTGRYYTVKTNKNKLGRNKFEINFRAVLGE